MNKVIVMFILFLVWGYFLNSSYIVYYQYDVVENY